MLIISLCRKFLLQYTSAKIMKISWHMSQLQAKTSGPIHSDTVLITFSVKRREYELLSFSKHGKTSKPIFPYVTKNFRRDPSYYTVSQKVPSVRLSVCYSVDHVKRVKYEDMIFTNSRVISPVSRSQNSSSVALLFTLNEAVKMGYPPVESRNFHQYAVITPKW